MEWKVPCTTIDSWRGKLWARMTLGWRWLCDIKWRIVRGKDCLQQLWKMEVDGVDFPFTSRHYWVQPMVVDGLPCGGGNFFKMLCYGRQIRGPWWASTKWASIWDLKRVWLGFEMLSIPKSIFLGPIKFPRFKRLNNDVITRIWLINSMWKWFNQVIKNNARNRIKKGLEANFRVWENHLGFWFQPSFWGFNWIPTI